jgi:hypothetical protein
VRNPTIKKGAIAALLVITPGIVHANAGVPMLFLAMPAFVISLLPIIAAEAVYLSKSLALSTGKAVRTVSIANVVSTVIGIPLTWVLLVLLQMVTGGGSAYGTNSTLGKVLAVTWQAPWLIPYEKDLHWMIPVAGLVLLVPFFFASWWSEYLVSKILLKDLSAIELKAKVRNANLISYGLLVFWPVGFWVVNTAMAK